jgi:aconitate hydratase 2/2-methylisocitrate dehydratase
MQGGYNIAPMVAALDDPVLGPLAADQLSTTLLVFDAFHDVGG